MAMYFILIAAMCGINIVHAQIEDVIVERYYVSDANDASDTTGGRSIPEGSVTYRVFIDMTAGSKIKSIYGDANHPLIITSTDTFYNNVDRPNSNFGYELNKGWFNSNPTIALDSWLTLGLAEKTHLGIPKEMDADGSFVGGTNNGGTAGIPGGILVNNDSTAGSPLTQSDGYVPSTQVLGQWIDIGFKDILTGDDTTVFGAYRQGTEFKSYNISLRQNQGVIGSDTSENIVLVAQFTTKGEISFKLNVQLEIPDGNSSKIVNYVADGSVLLSGEVLSPYLSYPPVCGCTDPGYLEFEPSYGCNIQDSCKTLIVFGCTDTAACNYDPGVNFNIPELCCFPGLCNDRDLAVVCPDLLAERYHNFELFPNPADNILNFQVQLENKQNLHISIFDSFGRLVMEHETGVVAGPYSGALNISQLANGVYNMNISNKDLSKTYRFIKM